ncbi:MAG: DUF1292 domain-containing protein [Bacilli bacterium]|nr:DUF1292 domain-containing protein [Bacilli bacterium]
MNKATIIDTDNSQSDVELVTIFPSNDNTKEYIIYSKGEKDVTGNEKVYVSGLDRENNILVLTGIQDDNEWLEVKNKMLKIIGGV